MVQKAGLFLGGAKAEAADSTDAHINGLRHANQYCGSYHSSPIPITAPVPHRDREIITGWALKCLQATPTPFWACVRLRSERCTLERWTRQLRGSHIYLTTSKSRNNRMGYL